MTAHDFRVLMATEAVPWGVSPALDQWRLDELAAQRREEGTR